MPTGKKLTSEQVAYVCRHFHNTANKELARAIGASRSAVCNIAARHHLVKDKDYIRAVNLAVCALSPRRGVGIALTPEIVAKRVAKRKETFRTERARVLFGLPQRTKMKVIAKPAKKVKQASYLRLRGYEVDMVRNVAYWGEGTRRAVRMEKGGGIWKFMPRTINTNQ